MVKGVDSYTSLFNDDAKAIMRVGREENLKGCKKVLKIFTFKTSGK